MSEAFVLLDDVRPGREASILFSGLAGTILAHQAADVSLALEALSAAGENGFFAAGSFAARIDPRHDPRFGARLNSRTDACRFAAAYKQQH